MLKCTFIFTTFNHILYISVIDHFNLITFTPIYMYQAHPQWMWNNISTQCKSSIFLVIVYTHDKDIRNGFVRCFWMNIVCYFTDEKWLSFFILSRGHWTGKYSCCKTSYASTTPSTSCTDEKFIIIHTKISHFGLVVFTYSYSFCLFLSNCQKSILFNWLWGR